MLNLPTSIRSKSVDTDDDDGEDGGGKVYTIGDGEDGD
jgi:hypothetical protein